jgi:hypothetical protein
MRCVANQEDIHALVNAPEWDKIDFIHWLGVMLGGIIAMDILFEDADCILDILGDETETFLR